MTDAPTYRSETRHHPLGKVCHHFAYHRLTCDDFDALCARASGRCEICETPEADTGGKRLVVDHFQGAGVSFVRGLLCDKCNAVMACFDGHKPWGTNRRWEARAGAYEASSWQRPTAEVLVRVNHERQRRRERLEEHARWREGLKLHSSADAAGRVTRHALPTTAPEIGDADAATDPQLPLLTAAEARLAARALRKSDDPEARRLGRELARRLRTSNEAESRLAG